MTSDKETNIVALVSTFLACAIISFSLRVYVRLRIIKSFGADDIWMAFALIVYIANSACNFEAVHYGLARTASESFGPSDSKAIEFWWLCNMTYSITMLLIKTSVGIILLRFTFDVIYRWILYFAMFANFLNGTIFVVLGLVMCIPIQDIWDRSRSGGGKCLSSQTLLGVIYVYSTVSVLNDLVFALSPIFLMWKLNLSLRSRILLIPIFSLACVASIAVLIRFAYIDRLTSDDYFRLATDFAFWCDVESGLAIFAANLATLRPLFRKIGLSFGYSASDDSTRARFNRLKIASIRPHRWTGGFGDRSSKAPRNSIGMPALGRGPGNNPLGDDAYRIWKPSLVYSRNEKRDPRSRAL